MARWVWVVVRPIRTPRERAVYAAILAPFITVVLALQKHFQKHEDWASSVRDAVAPVVIAAIILLVGSKWIIPWLRRPGGPSGGGNTPDA